MQKITVISVGKIKESYFKEAIDEYAKRLKCYADLQFIELKDLPAPEKLSKSEQKALLDKEGQRIKEKIPTNSFVIALCVEGKQLSSEELAAFINKSTLAGEARLVFVIGSSLGLSDEIKNMADFKLSFSKMTFPHRLMKVILLEQTYRAYTIIDGKTYHK